MALYLISFAQNIILILTTTTTMALRIMSLRTATIPARHFHYIHRSLCVAQDLLAAPLTTPASPSKCKSRHVRDSYNSFYVLNARSFSGSSNSDGEGTTNKSSKKESDNSQGHGEQPVLLYEGPFAQLTLRLKRISLMSAVIGIVGLPALSMFYGGGSIPVSGQLAIIGTAGVAAVGSTALLGYCFSPYVHTLERLSPSATSNKNEEDGVDATTTTNNESMNANENLLRIVTRDILARRVETIFDPTTDVFPPPTNNSRPFCNFMVRGLPMYVHKEMIHDLKLRLQLLGEEPPQDLEPKKKSDDDEFL